MGRFKRERKTYKLTFEGGDLEGLEVTMRSLPTEDFLAVAELADGAAGNFGASQDILRVLGKQLVEWNLDGDDDTPVPATYEGLVSQELDLVMRLFRAWMAAMGDVPAPLRNGSSGGATSLEQSLPMELASLSQEN